MALTPNFDRIVASITDSDIERFLRSTAPEDDKQRVRNAASNEVRMRLVGGYLIRTNQVSAERLGGKSKIVKSSVQSRSSKVTKAKAG